jgi:hypothetical protein
VQVHCLSLLKIILILTHHCTISIYNKVSNKVIHTILYINKKQMKVGKKQSAPHHSIFIILKIETLYLYFFLKLCFMEERIVTILKINTNRMCKVVRPNGIYFEEKNCHSFIRSPGQDDCG